MLFDNRVRSKQKLKLPCSSSIVSIFDSVEKEPEWPMVLSYRKKLINALFSGYKLVPESEEKEKLDRVSGKILELSNFPNILMII